MGKCIFMLGPTTGTNTNFASKCIMNIGRVNKIGLIGLEYNNFESVLFARTISHGLLHTGQTRRVMYRHFAYHVMTIRMKELNFQSIEKKYYLVCPM